MKKILCILLVAIVLATVCACGSEEPAKEITIQQFIEGKGFPEGTVMTVSVLSVENPALALVGDKTGSIYVFGLNEGADLSTLGIKVGSTFTIKDGQYNEYEGQVEIKNPTLVSLR